ncbi:hypothetical protein O2N63_02235 [Aliiroseovarius sp. KMU-50]|uniref:Phosphatase PAP2 family protein n=1 Tax=Aliiroseovarius salicola TaxID=3009082 RepID=A0ABT4VXB7_9RHOB|nr:hypothetical protein [Aliiroseovarius sp. KMU-50]MDA5092894.1 hypothetical protein [Aliiroseovarius sp. KMU-50]
MIIWIASVHLAWHYAVDGLVAGVAVWITWVVIRQLLGLRASWSD